MEQRTLRRPSWSNAQLAVRLRKEVEPTGMAMDRSEVVKIEKGKIPNWAELAALSHVFDVSFEDTVRLLIASIEVVNRRTNVPFELGLLIGASRGSRSHTQTDSNGLKSPFDETTGLNSASESHQQTAKTVLRTSVNVPTRSRRSVSRTAVSERGLVVAIEKLGQIAESLLLGQKAIADTLASLEHGRQTPGIGAQSAQRSAPDK